jgi:hypothetical protein
MTAVAASAEDFTIIGLPDTQNYSCGAPCGSSSTIFSAQTQWIVNNKETLNIAYVAHEGDIVEHATTAVEWDRASGAMSLLEDPVTTSLPDGIPYGVLRGNHDQESTYNYYNQHFGVGRFSGRSYYGGGFSGTNNNNNYGLFRASGMDFIVINLEYNPSAAVLSWADALLGTYSNRRAIVVSHDIINTGNPGAFSSAGQAIYNALKDNPNLFLMLCGHIHGEGRRVDVYNGNTVNTLLADYQSYANGGDGFLRILHFSPARNEITVETYSPSLAQYERDSNSQFILQYDMSEPVLTTVTSLDPSVATAGGAAFKLTVSGTNFVSGAKVRWNGTDRVTTFVSATRLQASIPAADIATAGTVPVTVFNPEGGLSNTMNFTVWGPLPVVTSLSPSYATAGRSAFTLTVSGTNFISGAKVRWNGTDRVTTFVSATRLQASIPAADIATTRTIPVTVLNPDGGLSNTMNFTVWGGRTWRW